MDNKREIALKDFYGHGRHVYKDELGFRDEMKEEARTLVAREVFRVLIEDVGYHLAFYDPVTDTFYGIQTETFPIKVKILPRDRTLSPYIGYQCNCDPDDDGQVIASFDDVHQIWDNLQIDNTPFEDVIRRSFITSLT